MDVWIALVKSDKQDEFKLVLCDTKSPITDYIEGREIISTIAAKHFKENSIHVILNNYCRNIEMGYKTCCVSKDNKAAEITYRRGIEEIVACKTGLELVMN